MRRRLTRWLFYPTLAWTYFWARVARRWQWWSRIDDRVLVGAAPFPAHVPALRREGVTGVINTCEEYAGPQAAYAAAGIEQLRLPTIDFTPPTLADIERGVAFVREHVTRGETVYIHCKAGRGRSATIALCWLIESRGLSPEEGLAWLRARRPQVLATLARRRVVQEFAAKHRAG